ncbi:hypothetical protein GO491_11645 [Flavobacteriaceae bacterium Ap0902]|nr:hypothetical protein [Flavobacteriaceae bacterium Ap0902]
MKKIVLSIALASICVGVSAQQTEMKATQDAYQNKNYSVALQQAALAESKLDSDPTIEPEALAHFYYAAAESAKQSGDLIKAGEYYDKLKNIEGKTFYKTRNKDTKNWEYYFNQAKANQVASAGNYTKVKSETAPESIVNLDVAKLNQEAANALQNGNTAFNNKAYKKAADNFLEAYYLYKIIGQDRPLFKYYAALGYVQSKEFDKSADLFQSLLDVGFTGVETNYIATNADGKDVSFSTQADMDTQVKLGLASNPRTEKTESLQQDLYSNAAYTYYQLEQFDKTIEVGQEGLELYPDNENMSKLVTAAYQRSGKVDDFIASLQDKVDNGSADAVDYFNLAKSLEDKDFDANYDKAKTYYSKAIEMNPDFGDAHLNYAFLIIAPEKDLVAKMNENLGSSEQEKEIYTENKQKRKTLYQEALPHLEKAYKQNPDNPSLIKILKNSYEVVGNDDKYTEFKEKYDAIVQP